MRVSVRTTFYAVITAMLSTCLPVAAQTPPVAVTIDGAPVTFDQPPVEQAGRVFVPLRGVFEKLGASVVFDRGHINATKGPTTVSLTVGSTAALVNGQHQFLDNPPFLIGSRVLVPLRFVSQALGTTVAFVRATRTVAITLPAGRTVPRHTLDVGTSSALMNLMPADRSAASPHLAQIAADFTRPVDPGSVRVSLDGSDVTPEIYATAKSIAYYVTAPLAAGKHTVSVSGRYADGQALTGTWSFSKP